jgi:imidazoleglycerol phosphate synthase glutamine amidotransferase subunit HisH
MKIVIINYGGNIQSIMFAIERFGLPVLSNDWKEIKADKVIFRALVKQVLQ